MRKRSLKRRTAFILAFIMIFMNCFNIFAEETVPDQPEYSDNTEYSEGVENTSGEVPAIKAEDSSGDEADSTEENRSTDTAEDSSGDEADSTEENRSTDTAKDSSGDEADEITEVEADPEDPDSMYNADSSSSNEAAGEDSGEDDYVTPVSLMDNDIDMLGEGEESDPDFGVWHSIEGILWKVEGNKLSISANAEAPDRGFMPDFSINITTGESDSEWLAKKYRDVITTVEFLDSKTDPDAKVYHIGRHAFACCTELQVINIPSSVTEIGYGAFIGCTKLSQVPIRENDHFVTDSKSGILYRKITDDSYEMLFAPLNKWGSTLSISDKTTDIASFACWGAKCYDGTLYIPESVEVINEHAFSGCSNLTRIYMGKRGFGEDGDPELVKKCCSSLREIKSNAFSNCNSLKEVFIPSSVTKIDQSAFKEDSYLTYVYCFAVDPELYEMEGPEHGVRYRFQVCDGFKEISFPNTECDIVYIPWNYCIVTFSPTISVRGDINGDKLLPTCVKYGTTIASTSTEEKLRNGLYVLAKDDYVFEGWVDDKKGQPFNYRTEEIVTDTRLKAKWQALYTVKFITGIGSFPDPDPSMDSTTSAERTISKDSVLTDWPADPVKTDARFVGWQIGSKDMGSILLVNKDDPGAAKFANKLKRETYKFKGTDYTLYAYYEDYPLMNFWSENGTENLYKKLKGNDSNGMNIKYNMPFTREQVDEINTMSMNYWNSVHGGSSRWEFKGWYSRVGGKGTPLRVDTSTKLYSAMPVKYYIYFKQYLKVTYHYCYDREGTGEEDYSETVEHLEAKTDYSLKLPPYRKGYVFKGWWSTEDESGFQYAAKIPANSMTADKEFYAHWQKLCTITLDRRYEQVYDKEYLDKHPDLKESVIVENITKGNALYYDPGMIPYDRRELADEGDRLKFNGWWTDPEDGKGKRIESTTEITEDMTLYAHWIKGWAVNYWVDIRETGGKTLFWGTVLTPGAKLPLPPDDLGDPDPLEFNYRGYIFDGWEDDDGNPPAPSMTVRNDMDFTAQWYDDPNTPNEPQFTVSFDSLGGPEVPSQTVSENTFLTEPETPVWKDHKFLGWFKEKDFTNLWDFENEPVTQDGILYAKWKYWTEEDEAEYQDNLKGIYWVKIIKDEKLSLAKYFKDSGLSYTYDKNIVKFSKGKRTVKGKKFGSTLISAMRADGSSYNTAVRLFVINQELLDMFAFNTSTTINAVDFLTVSGFLPDRWESSKPSVASIDAKTGLINVNGRGTTKIKAFYQEKPVIAVLSSEVPKFAKKFYRFQTGQSKKIKIKKLKRYDIVSWNLSCTPKPVSSGSVSDNVSSNRYHYGDIDGGEGFAEIDDNGRLTAVSAGEVTLYATVYGQTISTKIHIEPPSLTQKTLEIDTNKVGRLRLKRTKLKYVEWDSSNDNVAYVDPTSGKVYALKAGRAVVRTRAGGVLNSCTVIVKDAGSMTDYNKKRKT